MASADQDGSVDALLASVTADYDLAIAYSRPDEILLS